MAKRLKLRLSRILSNCRSKDFPSDPLPVPKSTPSSMIPYTTAADSLNSFTRKQTFRWKQEKDFHVISISTVRDKPIASAHTANVFPRPSVARRVRRRHATMQRGRKHGRARLAPLPSIGRDTSGTEDEDPDETECLMSSASFSDEEGSFSEASAEEKGVVLMRRRVSEVEFEARLSSVEKRWRCGSGPMRRRTTTMTTKVRESYAVVKRTEDPYGEFRRSMMEMVTEKEIYEEDELQELLRCLLSLNGREHHGIILRAFAEVCYALFRKKIMFDRDRDYYQRDCY